MSGNEHSSNGESEVVRKGNGKTAGAPGVVVVDEDPPAAPSKEVSSKKQSLSDLFTIVCVSC